MGARWASGGRRDSGVGEDSNFKAARAAYDRQSHPSDFVAFPAGAEATAVGKAAVVGEGYVVYVCHYILVEL